MLSNICSILKHIFKFVVATVHQITKTDCNYWNASVCWL